MPFVLSNEQLELLFAIGENDPERVLKALQDGADPNGAFPLQRSLPLHWATQRSAHHALRVLLEAGAVIQPRSMFRDTGQLGEEAILLPQLLAFDGGHTNLDVVSTWLRFDPTLTAAFPSEAKAADGKDPWVDTPLSLLLFGVREHELYVASDSSNAEPSAPLDPALADARFRVGQCLEWFHQRPTEWSPETTQAVFCSAIGSCSPAIWAEEGPLKKLGLDLSMVSHPEALLSVAQTLVYLYPDQTHRAVAWMKIIAPLGAEWTATEAFRDGRASPELSALQGPYREWMLDARLPAPSKGLKPRF